MQSENERSYNMHEGFLHNKPKYKKLLRRAIFPVLFWNGFYILSNCAAYLLLRYSGRIAGFFGAEQAAQILMQLEERGLWMDMRLGFMIGCVYGVIVFIKKKACIAVGIPLFIIAIALAILTSSCNGIGTWDVLKYLISVM